MSRTPSLPLLFVVWGSALGLACQIVSAQVPDPTLADSSLPQLLQPATLLQQTSRVIGPEVVQRRGVEVDAELLKNLEPVGNNQLVFNLFPGTTFTGRVEGKTPAIEQLPMQPGDVDRTWADLERSRAELGYEPKTGFEEGLRRQWEWMEAGIRSQESGVRSQGRG